MGTYSSYIAGINHGDRMRYAKKLVPGTILRYSPEDNPYDENAVALYDKDFNGLGYIPAKHAGWVRQRVDKERSLKIVVKAIRKEGFIFTRKCFVDIEIRTGADAD